MEFRIDLTYDGTTTTLQPNEEPNGLASLSSQLSRDFDTSGVFFRFTESDLKLQFPGQGRTIFQTARNTEGMDAVVQIQIFERPDQYTAYELLYTGQAVMENLAINTDYAEVDFEEIDIVKTLTDRLDLPVAAERTEDLDGNAINAATSTSVNITGRPIQRETKLQVKNLGIDSNSTLNAFNGTLQIQGSDEFIQFEDVLDENEWVVSNQNGFIDSESFIDNYDTEFNVGGLLNIFYEGRPYTGQIRIAGSIVIVEISSNPWTSGFLKVWIKRNNLTNNTSEYILAHEYDLTDPKYDGIFGAPEEIDFTLTETISYKRSYELIFDLSGASNPGLGFIVLWRGGLRPIRLEMTLQTKVPVINAASYFLHEAVRHNIEVLTGEANGLYSEYLGRTQDGYVSDGIGSEFVETVGYRLRNVNRDHVISFANRMRSLISIFNLGWGVEDRYDAFQIRIEPREHFYQDVLLEEFEEIEIDSYSEEFYPWFSYSKIQIGYDKYVDGDDFQGTLQDFNTVATYSSPIKFYPNQSRDFLSAYIASDILLELTRRQVLESRENTNWKNDEDIFIIDVNDVGSPGTYRQGSEQDIDLDGIDYDGDANLNWTLNPRFNQYNLSNILNSQAFTKPDTSLYRNTKYDIDGSIKIFYGSGLPAIGDTTIYTSASAPRVDADNQLPFEGERLFDPILIRFKNVITAQQQARLIKAHRNSLETGENYGYIRVKNPDGEWVEGWLLDLRWNIVDKIGTFEIIRKNMIQPPPPPPPLDIDISTSLFNGREGTLGAVEQRGLFFDSITGLSFFTTRDTTVVQFVLNTAYDIDDPSGLTTTFTSGNTTSSGLAFNSSGTKMYLFDTTGGNLKEYNLNTAFNFSAGVSLANSRAFANFKDLCFNTSGSRMYVIFDDGVSAELREYALSVNFDTSSSLALLNTLSIATQDSNPLGLHSNPDGTIFYVIGNTNNRIFQYNLSIGFDLSTAVYSGNSFVNPRDTDTRYVYFRDDYQYWMLGNNSNLLSEFIIYP